MRRSELRRSPITRNALSASSSSISRTPLRRVSPRRAREQRTYTTLRREFLAARPVCEYPDCDKAATDVHHRKGRVGALYLDVTHWSALCRTHHDWCGQRPAEAVAMGLSERRVS